MPTVIEKGFFHGFNGKALVAVVSSSLGGLVVAAVLKVCMRRSNGTHDTAPAVPLSPLSHLRSPHRQHADAILKGYATALSVVLTAALSA